MGKIDEEMEKVVAKLEAKYWDFPFKPDRQVIESYDSNDNPLIIRYYQGENLKFTHYLTYDVNGRMTEKKLVLN